MLIITPYILICSYLYRLSMTDDPLIIQTGLRYQEHSAQVQDS